MKTYQKKLTVHQAWLMNSAFKMSSDVRSLIEDFATAYVLRHYLDEQPQPKTNEHEN